MLPRAITRRWNIHESTQRGLVRLAFVCLGLLPTFGCLIWLLFAATPWHARWMARRAEQLLAHQIGMNVSIGSAKQTAPDRIDWQNVRLTHPETGQEVVKAARVQWAFRDGAWLVQIVGAELQSEHGPYAWRALHDWFVCRPSQAHQAFRLLLPSLQIHYPQGTYELTDVLAIAKPSQSDFQGALSYHQSNDLPSAKVQWTLIRHHDEIAPTTKVQLETIDCTIPCETWAAWWPSLQLIGPTTRFGGRVAFAFHDREWISFESEGRLLGVDLERLTATLPYRMRGIADISLDNAAYFRGKLDRLRGQLTSREGTIEKNLLLHSMSPQSLAARGYPDRVNAMNPLVHFDDLGLQFDLDATGLLLEGLVLQPEQPGGDRVLLASHQQSILYHPQGRVPVENVARWLSVHALPRPHESKEDMHLTQQVRSWLVNHLPRTDAPKGRISSFPTNVNTPR